MSIKNHHHCVIIGAGPAGYTAAIYAARANMNPVMFTGQQPGGQLMITTEVENFPGYPQGVTGPTMMKDLMEQASRFGTDIRYNTINKVDFSVRPFKIWADDDTEYTSDSIIIATGASAKWLGIEDEQRLMNMGVSACAVCDGFFFKGLEVSVVGGGDTAAEEAQYLAKLCPKVHLFVRKDELRASKIMAERVMNTPNIEVHWNTEVKAIKGEQDVEAAVVVNNKTQEVKEIPLKAVFIAIGHKPNTDVFKDYLKLNDAGYIETIGKSSKTNIEGVFASGDAQDFIYRQAITAAGTGCMAALDAERYLTEKGII